MQWARAELEQSGDVETASRLDAILMARQVKMSHGATFGHVREARRACARKDLERCRALAQTVIDAWGAADAKVPTVDEMRKLVAGLPSAAPHAPP